MSLTHLLCVKDDHAFSYCFPSTVFIIFSHIKLHINIPSVKAQNLKSGCSFQLLRFFTNLPQKLVLSFHF